MPTLEELRTVMTRKERAAALRMVRRGGWTEEAACGHVLRRQAGACGMEAWFSERQRIQAKAASALAARQAASALKRAPRVPVVPDHGDFWVGWFDGSAFPNPGRIGLGGLITAPDGETHEICVSAGTGGSNEAEYLALIAVLEKALSCAVLRLRLWGDSQVVINDVNSKVQHAASKGARGLEGHRDTVRALLARFENVQLQWVPRHKNLAADRLSQQARSLA